MSRTNKFKSQCKIESELEDLVTDLHSTLITKRLKAVKGLGKLKTPLAIEPLTRVLADRSKEVRCATVEAIYLINPTELCSLLIPLAKDRSADVRLRVAHALRKSDSHEAVVCLLSLMRDSKDSVANMAAKSLSKNPKAAISKLIKQFGDKIWKIRSRSAMSVALMGKNALEALKAASSDPDANIRFWSILCIGKLRDRNLAPLILEKLQDRNISVRVGALRALREIGDPNVASKLFEALSQPSDQIRDLIYEILKDFGTHSIPYLMESLSSEYWMGRSLAAQSLSDMGSEAVYPLVSALESEDKERRYWAIKILGKMKERVAFADIKKLLSDPDPEIRMSALEAMEHYLDTDVISDIIERFLDPVWIVRKCASRAISKFGGRAVPQLLRALESSEEDVRYWALCSIGDIKPQGALTHVLRLFKDKSWTIRKTASDVLGGYGEDALLELSGLATESSDAEIRYWVLRSLGKIGSEISLPLLFRALEDGSEAIRDAAQKALSNYGAEVIDDLFALFKSENRKMLESVCVTFQRMPPEVAVPRLCDCLGRYDEHVSYWIRKTLHGFGSFSREYIIQLLQSKNDEVRRQCILAMGDFGVKEDYQTLLGFLKDEYWPARIATAEALGNLQVSEAIPNLLQALDDEDEDLAMAAIISLGKIGDEKAVPGLITTLQRESWSLRFQAIKILGEMRVKRAFPDLLKLLDEDTIDLKTHIIKAIAKTNHPNCYKELKKRFDQEITLETRLAYIGALAETENPALVSEFIKLAGKQNLWEERRAAIRALGILKSEKAKTCLISSLKDSDPIISREALIALGAILSPEEFEKTEKALTAARKKHEEFQKSFKEGMKLMRVSAMKDAEKLLKHAIKINPRAAYVYSALGNLYYKTGKLIDATKAYIMATNMSPEDITLKLNLGMVYYRRRAFKESLQIFSKVVKLAGQKSQQGQYAEKMFNKIKLESQKKVK